MTTLPIASLYAIPLGTIYLILWVNVVRTRAALNVSIGDGGDIALHERIRRHGNFVEWVPMVMILLILAETQGASSTLLHVVGGLLLLGRIIHPFGLHANKPAHVLRLVGNSSNVLATAVGLICLGVKLLGT